MALNEQGILDRDQLVFQKAKNANIPICMTLSGGYSKKSSDIIAASILNLKEKELLTHEVKEL